MVRQLQPWHENLGKRQVKAPKIYFHDTGLLHALLGVESHAQLLRHHGRAHPGRALRSSRCCAWRSLSKPTSGRLTPAPSSTC